MNKELLHRVFLFVLLVVAVQTKSIAKRQSDFESESESSSSWSSWSSSSWSSWSESGSETVTESSWSSWSESYTETFYTVTPSYDTINPSYDTSTLSFTDEPYTDGSTEGSSNLEQLFDFDIDVELNSGITLRQCLTEIKSVGGYSNEELFFLVDMQRKLRIIGVKKWRGYFDWDVNNWNDFTISNSMKNSTPEVSACSNLVFQLDILPTLKQMKEILVAAAKYAGLNSTEYSLLGIIDSDSEITPQRKKRSLTDDNDALWFTPITYRINSDVSKSLVQSAISAWEDNTCVTFEYSKLSLRQLRGNFISFKKGKGCYSNVGKKTSRKAQTISLSNDCLKKYSVAHEIGHALGLWHEQSRSDRDDHVEVNSDNIADKYLKDFLPQDNDKNFGIEYDHGSVMHYSSSAYSTEEGKKTIEAKDARNQLAMGQRAALSFSDVKIINNAYCSSVCKNNLNCKHNGYVDPKDCNKCRCPEGFGSTTCDNPQQSDDKCKNTDLSPTSSWKEISVVGKAKCYWRIKARSGKKVAIKIESLNFACFKTCVAYVELKTESNFGKTGARYCCSKPTQTFTSATREALIIFNGKSSTAKLTFKYKTA